jgi:hypothetical protein
MMKIELMIRQGHKAMIMITLAALSVMLAMLSAPPAYAQSQSEICQRLAEQQGYVASDFQNAMWLRKTYNEGNFTYGERKEMQDRVDRALAAARALDAEVIAAHCLDQSSPSSSSSASYVEPAPPPFDFNAALGALQVTVNQGNQYANSAVTYYTQGRKADACTASKASSAAYAKAKIDARAILGRQPYVRYIDIYKIDANAKQAEADETEFYCAP